MNLHYEDDRVTLWHGDCIEVLSTLPDSSVDAVVCDPPYGLEFMGKDWDRFDTYAGGNPHMKPQAATVGDSSGVTYGYRQKNPRCRRCGKLMRGNGACKCPEPQIDTRTAESANQFQAWCEDWATEAWRVLKPGGHMLAFGGTRTWHRLVVAVEDAGFEIRDSIAWLYGSGFPKSLDVSKAIDKAAGAEREVVGTERTPYTVTAEMMQSRAKQSAEGYRPAGEDYRGEASQVGDDGYRVKIITAPATPDAERWQGWGTALKPSFEPIVVARKPLVGTVAANVLAHGTGALNIDATRVGFASEADRQSAQSLAELRAKGRRIGVLGEPGQGDSLSVSKSGDTRTGHEQVNTNPAGRWPTNVVLDGHTADALDEQSGVSKSPAPYVQATKKRGEVYNLGSLNDKAGKVSTHHGDSGGASRFFPTFRYQAKAPARERPRYKREGGSDNATTYGQMKTRECNVCGSRAKSAGGEHSGKPWPSCGHDDWSWVEQQSARDEFVAHPTVKPLELMRWLVRLVTPPGGVVLDPFAGSGATVEAALLEGFACIAIEREADYLPLIQVRIDRQQQPGQGAARGSCA